MLQFGFDEFNILFIDNAHRKQIMNKQDKAELAEFIIDQKALAEKEAFEAQEDERRVWAQNNGNDSGFDPYWNLD